MRYLLVFGLFTLLSCTASSSSEESKPNRTDLVKAKAEQYFATFSQREDWQELLSYYREDMIFEDIFLQIQLDSLWQFERFYNWPDTNFRKLSPEQQHLSIEHLVANDSTAMAYGHLNPFYWYGNLVDLDWGMQFTIILHFDEDLKIKKQVDWMEYDDKTQESVIKRYREVGVDDPPAWLNLER